MSRPERFDTRTAEPLPAPRCAREPAPTPLAAPQCDACAEELRCPFRALARWLAP